MDTAVSSKVGSVTVYPNQALISLEGSIVLESGRQTLIFDDLPMSLIRDSVRFAGKGNASVRVFGVDLRRTHYETTPSANVGELEQQIEEVEDQLLVISDERAVLEAEAEYLLGMSEATDQYARGLSIGRTKIDDQERLSKSLREQDRKNRQASRSLLVKERSVRKSLDKLKRELADLHSGRLKERYQARVEVEVVADGDYRAELNYVVRNAQWKPLYDIRLLDESGEIRLQVTNLAQITQRSGQDWTDVRMLLSTARTALTQRLPELNPWYLDEYQRPEPVALAEPKRAMAPSNMVKDVRFEAAALDEMEPQYIGVTEHAIAESEQSQSVTSYIIEGNVDIPSDGFPHKTTIGEFYLDPKIDYFVVPKHTDAVYRRVKASNDGPGPMLAGKASLFVGDDFIGMSQVDFIPVGDEIKVLLGVEDRITVERKLKRRDVDKVRLRDRRQSIYGYEICLKNLMLAETSIELQDHFPVSRHEEIKIKLLSAAPEPDELSDLNLLTWNVKVGPGDENKILFEFQVEHPRSMLVDGLYD